MPRPSSTTSSSPPPPAPAGAIPQNPAANPKPVAPAQPNLPIEPPIRGKDGKVITITQPLFWQAMDHNTAVTPKTREAAKVFFERRLRKYEKIVTDNADLMRQVNEGVIDNSDLVPNRDQGRKAIQNPGKGKVSLSALMQILKPLVGDNCREEISTKTGIITRMQAGQNVKVMQAYNAEVAADFEKSLPALGANATKEEQDKRKEQLNRERQRQLMYQWIDEATYAYRGLIDTASEKVDDYLAKAGVATAGVAEEVKAVKAAKDRDSRIEAMKKLMLKITVDQERAILQAVRDTRPPAPELPDAPGTEGAK